MRRHLNARGGHPATPTRIADKLVITLRAVEKYVSTTLGKLGNPSTGSDSRRVLAAQL